MAAIKFFIYGSKKDQVPIHVRLSYGRKENAMELIDESTGLMKCKVCGFERTAERKSNSEDFIKGSWQCENKCDPSPGAGYFITESGLYVDPSRWSNKTEDIKQRIRTESDNELTDSLAALKKHILKESAAFTGIRSKEWLSDIVTRYRTKDSSVDTMNGFIQSFIDKATHGQVKNKDAVNFAVGTLTNFRGFQRVFNEYQGIYSEDRLDELIKKKKTPRPIKMLDFQDITVDFYNDFTAYMSNEGYMINSIGKTIKTLKFFMRKALSEKKHSSREFMEGAFKGMSADSNAVYLTTDEIDVIYNYDLTDQPRMELARDAFVILCETALRISDYKKIPTSVVEHDGIKYIDMHTTKTGERVIIPMMSRTEAILEKYDGDVPRIPEQYINKLIKQVAALCGIDEVIHFPAQKFGKKYTATAKKYEKITCHTGRRSGATNMYKSGIPILDIMKITSHRSESVFLKYIRITPEESARRLAQHPYFRNGRLKVV